jgi:hypothetical protein
MTNKEEKVVIKVFADGSYEIEASDETKEKCEKMLSENPELIDGVNDICSFSKMLYTLDVATHYDEALKTQSPQDAFEKCIELLKEQEDDGYVIEYNNGLFNDYMIDGATKDKIMQWDPYDGFLDNPFATDEQPIGEIIIN